MPSSKKKLVKPAALGIGAGGPGTARGMNFQTKYAVLEALRALQHFLAYPVDSHSVQMEARLGEADNATQWDVNASLGGRAAEAKLSPSRQEVKEFVARVSRAQKMKTPPTEYVLVYGKAKNTLLNKLEQLTQVAKEARGTNSDFQRLMQVKEIAQSEELLKLIDEEPAAALGRVSLEQISEASLDRMLETVAISTSGTANSKGLIDLVFKLLSEAAEKRQSVPVSRLANDAATRGIPLQAPPLKELAEGHRGIVDILGVLQFFADGLPLGVLSHAARKSPEDVRQMLQLQFENQTITEARGRCKAAVLPRPLEVSSPDVYAHGLRAVLDWVAHESGTALTATDFVGAFQLAKACAAERPEAAALIFSALDRPLKRLGNKHLVLQASNLAIDCARSIERGPAEIEGEARALICGKSWVYQRIGRLPEARAAAEKSLELGRKIGSQKNTAFCEKCIGRLCRVEADLPSTSDEARNHLLQESVRHLERAIQLFMEMENGTEVGDCYSLLGRTYLLSGKHRQAGQAVREAQDRLTDKSNKDYSDLLILQGDLARANGALGAAEGFYTEAIELQVSLDFERSEILARAHFQRAKNRLADDRPRALQDFQRAKEIWDQLEEHFLSAGAEWEEILISRRPPEEALRVLRAAPVGTRVRAVRLHEKRFGQVAATTPKRSAPSGPQYWRNLLAEAGQQEAAEAVEW